MPMVAQQAEMEDILSSIRTTLAEETAKVGGGSADLIDAAAQQDDEILELTAEEMLETPAADAPADELIDISAFAQTGDAVPAAPVAAEVDPLGEPVPAEEPVAAPVAEDIIASAGIVAPAELAAPVPADAGAADEFDRLLAEISQEQKQQISNAEEQKQALMAEEEPLGQPEITEPAADAEAPAAAAVSVEAVTAVAATAIQQQAAQPEYRLGMVESAEGIQVALPAEVLAMALRPMVQDWLNANLAGVVERLVKDEIAKLTQN